MPAGMEKVMPRGVRTLLLPHGANPGSTALSAFHMKDAQVMFSFVKSVHCLSFSLSSCSDFFCLFKLWDIFTGRCQKKMQMGWKARLYPTSSFSCS